MATTKIIYITDNGIIEAEAITFRDDETGLVQINDLQFEALEKAEVCGSQLTIRNRHVELGGVTIMLTETQAAAIHSELLSNIHDDYIHACHAEQHEM